jgi:hypothetical protein
MGMRVGAAKMKPNDLVPFTEEYRELTKRSGLLGNKIS